MGTQHGGESKSAILGRLNFAFSVKLICKPTKEDVHT